MDSAGAEGQCPPGKPYQFNATSFGVIRVCLVSNGVEHDFVDGPHVMGVNPDEKIVLTLNLVPYGRSSHTVNVRFRQDQSPEPGVATWTYPSMNGYAQLRYNGTVSNSMIPLDDVIRVIGKGFSMVGYTAKGNYRARVSDAGDALIVSKTGAMPVPPEENVELVATFVRNN